MSHPATVGGIPWPQFVAMMTAALSSTIGEALVYGVDFEMSVDGEVTQLRALTPRGDRACQIAGQEIAALESVELAALPAND